MQMFTLVWRELIGLLVFALAIGAIAFLAYQWYQRYQKKSKVPQTNKKRLAAFVVAFAVAAASPVVVSQLLSLPFFPKTFGPGIGPSPTYTNLLSFFWKSAGFERVADISYDPANVPPPIERKTPEKVRFELVAKEVISEIAPGVYQNYWTFNGTVPGPFLRVREGDTVEISLTNDPSSLHHHSIDLHAVAGPGGGAAATMVGPGETKSFSFKALYPGLFVYHCAEPNASTHMAHGMSGMILVEPAEGLPPVDRELYVMQQELYTAGSLGRKGLQLFDPQAMMDAQPQYVVFNGKVGGLNGKMSASVGEKIRVFFGNGGVNLASSFHVIGTVFDKVYPEGALRDPIHNVQTTLIPAGGSAVAELDALYPGNYPFVDHALARLDRGAWGVLKVEGAANPEIFTGTIEGGHGH